MPFTRFSSVKNHRAAAADRAAGMRGSESNNACSRQRLKLAAAAAAALPLSLLLLIRLLPYLETPSNLSLR